MGICDTVALYFGALCANARQNEMHAMYNRGVFYFYLFIYFVIRLEWIKPVNDLVI